MHTKFVLNGNLNLYYTKKQKWSNWRKTVWTGNSYLYTKNIIKNDLYHHHKQFKLFRETNIQNKRKYKIHQLGNGYFQQKKKPMVTLYWHSVIFLFSLKLFHFLNYLLCYTYKYITFFLYSRLLHLPKINIYTHLLKLQK